MYCCQRYIAIFTYSNQLLPSSPGVLLHILPRCSSKALQQNCFKQCKKQEAGCSQHKCIYCERVEFKQKNISLIATLTLSTVVEHHLTTSRKHKEGHMKLKALEGHHVSAGLRHARTQPACASQPLPQLYAVWVKIIAMNWWAAWCGWC